MVSSDDSTGDYSIQFTDSVPDIHPGSIIVIDRDTAVFYRFVVTADVSGNTMNITTVEAYLTDIFYNSEFTLSTAAKGKSEAKGLVFYPVEAYMMDDNGGYRVLHMGGSRKDNTRFTHNLWHQTLFDLDGYVFAEGDHYKFWLEKMNASLNVDLEMSFNFGGRTVSEAVNDYMERYRSEALQMNASLVGSFHVEEMVRFDVEGSFRYSKGYELWKHNLFRPASVKFVASGVPIVLTLRSDLFREVELSGSGKISAYTGYSNHAEGRMGFEWQQTGDMRPVNSFDNYFDFTPPTVEGKGQVQAKLWLFPRISVMLYDAVGPSFDFMPYLSDTVRGGFREQMLGQSNDYCAWSFESHAGLDLRCGLSTRFFGYEVGNVSTERWTCVDKKLYHSPYKVVHSSGRPQAGQAATVRFDVYDTNILFHKAEKTVLPQIVKFEAGGRLSSKYGIVRGGTVSVNWTPNNNDTLYAKLYDQDGHVMAWDTVEIRTNSSGDSHDPYDPNIPNDPDDPNDPNDPNNPNDPDDPDNPNDPYNPNDWVDLGLPSGLLWATRNVGASSPMDFGNHYAWGETSPKSYYDWETYAHCSEGNLYRLTKYCTNPCHGNYDSTYYYAPCYYHFYDGLTILQPCDDAATVHYGGRTPTKEEWTELHNYTTKQGVYLNGVSASKYTGPNGNSIILPYPGRRVDNELVRGGHTGFYWSSSLSTDDHSAYMFMPLYNLVIGPFPRYQGFAVRAVLDAQ